MRVQINLCVLPPDAFVCLCGWQFSPTGSNQVKRVWTVQTLQEQANLGIELLYAGGNLLTLDGVEVKAVGYVCVSGSPCALSKCHKRANS